MNLSQRIEALRSKMREQGIDYYYVPAADAHKNEYVPPAWQRRSYISGFTGSAGDALVGLNEAYLWTDPRYFLQAENELPKHFKLIKQIQGVAPVDGWLKQHAQGKTFAVDPRVISVSQAQKLQQAMMDVDGKFVSLPENLIDQIWRDRPALSQAPVIIQSEQFTGFSAKDKIAQLRLSLQQQGMHAHVVSLLDAVAWLYNIRGNDVAFNPLVISYAVVTEKEAILFVDLNKIKDKAYFAAQGISLASYSDFEGYLQKLNGKVLLDAASASLWVLQQLKAAKVHYDVSPITLMKACKNEVELKGMQLAHEKDAVSMVNFIHWLENNWRGQTELSVAKKLLETRQQDADFRDLSFDTISGYADNGAIVHYRVSPATDKALADDTLFLLDSGAQYWQGTTDITRVFHFGTPSKQEQQHYTLVLKGHLALRHAVFPFGTCGEHVDAFARQYLWQAGLNYGHGTGHGVGCYLCVHEGPQVIAQRATGVPLQAGMVVSNEPGVYFAGRYGIRIENLCYIKPHSKTEMGEFLTLEDLTLVPHNRKLIDKSMLTEQEIAWVDEYHALVYQKLHGRLQAAVAEWLKAATRPL